ncbi:MAG: hypothetical protein ACYTG0_38995 [Planctomycetota bacterium]|jgi:hypothetical protein
MSTDPGNRPCRHLRAKEMFYDTGAAPEDDSGSGIFWCGHTQNCLGPDERPASTDDCGPDRHCYER